MDKRNVVRLYITYFILLLAAFQINDTSHSLVATKKFMEDSKVGDGLSPEDADFMDSISVDLKSEEITRPAGAPNTNKLIVEKSEND
ncbi:hypothetical protein [Mucilaginibacter paludis]|uniref:Uncharacterized protein n=1 Tax=Mucilaginibacter paludis DSM 18603 TaxID=714943 RepID=H1Y3J9_9SPHI|nr:hypothetical protein [Mucilaginibacter paludis]EHQ29767.1 hypothetical protein Mucpa_5698 [Mucilaginibacter paludis DSM 18603]